MANEGTSNELDPQGNAIPGSQGATQPSASDPQGNAEPKKFAGMYDTLEEFENGYKSLQTKLNDVTKQVKEAVEPPTQVDPEVESALKFVDSRIGEKLSPILNQLEETQLRLAAPDYDEVKPLVEQVKKQYPSLSMTDAYQIAKGKQQFQKLQNVITEDNAEGSVSAADRAKATTVSQPATQPGRNGGITPTEIMKMSSNDYEAFMRSPAGEEYIQRRASGEI